MKTNTEDESIQKICQEIRSTVYEDNKNTVEFEEIKPHLWENIINFVFPFLWLGTFKIKAYTVNPVTKEKFLMTIGTNPVRTYAYQGVLNYLIENIHLTKNKSSFTVLWHGPSSINTETSYFYASDMLEVLEKFYEGKQRANYIIYDIKMNPIS